MPATVAHLAGRIVPPAQAGHRGQQAWNSSMARVLVVSDDSAVQTRIANIVAAIGHGVSIASCCRDALQESSVQRFGVALVSTRLPDGNGLSLLSELQQS